MGIYKLVLELLKVRKNNKLNDIDLNLYVNENRAVIYLKHKPIKEINLLLNNKICDDLANLIYLFDEFKNFIYFEFRSV